MPRFPRLLALALVPALLVAAACGGPSGNVAAVVDGREIPVTAVAASAALYTFLGEINGQGCGLPDAGETAEAACDRFTLSNLIQESLIAAYAEEHDLTTDSAEASAAVDDLEASMGEDVFAERLAANGITKADVVGLAERLFLFNVVRDDLAAGATDEELRAIYDESGEFTQIHAKHILLDDAAKADEIAAEVTVENFGALAREYSVDTGSAEQGGDLGPIPQSSLDADFVAGALALQPGEISAPVQTQFGWHIIQLVEVTKTPFDEAKEQIREQQAVEIYGDWLRARYAEAEIEVNPRYGRIDLTSGEVVPIRSTEDPASPSAEPVAVPSP